MPELLLEIFSEEIPARMQRRAAEDLKKLVQEQFFAAGFMPEAAHSFATPRRLCVVVTGLPTQQPDRREEKKGPRIGAPEQAITGFLKGAGLQSLDQCEIRSDKKGEYYVALLEEKGRVTADVIAEFVPEIMRKFPWPKAMRWGNGDLRWVRPIHSILCAFDGEIVPFNVGGFASNDQTAGHRFMAPAPITVRNFEDYCAALKRAKVILDSHEREEMILADAKSLCQAQGLELIEDQGLLVELAGLAEWPIALIGSFDEKFLTVPEEALTAAMKGHQKYFSVRDPKTGRLANKFICIANIEAPDGGVAMREGYERVLTARLSDAWFLYQQDLKTPLSEQAKKLDQVTFFDGLGTTGDKVKRMAVLARQFAPLVGADPEKAELAAKLAKADLVTHMVNEEAKLQGVMGRYYALEQGVDTDIADAIRDHYKPAGQEDDVPQAPISVAVALADKIDTLTAFWAIEKKPTGSKDPFALRRAALGIIEIIFANKLRLKLMEQLSQAKDQLKCDTQQNFLDDLLAFFHDRLDVFLKSKGHRHDYIEAVRIHADGRLEDDLVLIISKLDALEAFLTTDDGENLLAAYKRAANILKADEKTRTERSTVVKDSLLHEDAEKALYQALNVARQAATSAIEKEQFADAMATLASLRRPLDRFFDDVKVNADQEDLRQNRLAILANIREICDAVADLSRIEG
ncbi:MAG: glycine--tRNA ligase subunit beta [bacterium]